MARNLVAIVRWRWGLALGLVLTSGLAWRSLAASYPWQESLDQRRARIEHMDAQAKENLLRSQRRFAAMDPAEQEQLRRLDQQLSHAPNRDALRETMGRYFEWLKTLTPYERAELAELPADKRIERIRELQKREQGRRRPWLGRGGPWPFDRHRTWLKEPVSQEDMKGLTSFLTGYVASHQASFLAGLPEPERKGLESELKRIEDPSSKKLFLLWRMWPRWQANHAGNPPLLELSSQELGELRKDLSPGLRERLANMSEEEQRKSVSDLVRFVLFSHYASQRSSPPPAGSEKDLAAYLEKLPPEERDHLLNLPPDEMQRILWLKYWRSRLDGQPPPGGRSSRGPRPDSGHRGRPPGKDRLRQTPPEATPLLEKST